MNAPEYNERVRAARRNAHLPGCHRLAGAATALHKWKVTAEKWAGLTDAGPDYGLNPLSGEPYFSASVFQHGEPEKPDPRLWRIDVG